MKKSMILTVLVVALLSVGVLATTDTATSTVSITFSEISEIAVSGDPGLITIVAPAAAGSLPADQSEATTTMAWTSNVASGSTRKITGSIASLFSGIDLYAVFADPGAGGTAAAETKFTAATTDYDFVTAIGNCNVSGITITFRASVTAMVEAYTNTQIVVTWTLTEDAA